MVLVASLVGLAMTANLNLAAAHSGSSSHSHISQNDNNVHSNGAVVNNVGGSDGAHVNSECVFNSNNDKGTVCHDNTKDRPH